MALGVPGLVSESLGGLLLIAAWGKTPSKLAAHHKVPQTKHEGRMWGKR